ncbi:hypothetical protein MKZ38_010793 [Zalerion maritima]|uniref:Uncharacterized protein n=1 Tax=Zalerion maritima TaxID=339359 RepID=A0AAD5RY68_9PEZI|nr:hypothetical protein MKZ38_010793 [Zalerion maritima]
MPAFQDCELCTQQENHVHLNSRPLRVQGGNVGDTVERGLRVMFTEEIMEFPSASGEGDGSVGETGAAGDFGGSGGDGGRLSRFGDWIGGRNGGDGDEMPALRPRRVPPSVVTTDVVVHPAGGASGRDSFDSRTTATPRASTAPGLRLPSLRPPPPGLALAYDQGHGAFALRVRAAGRAQDRTQAPAQANSSSEIHVAGERAQTPNPPFAARRARKRARLARLNRALEEKEKETKQSENEEDEE